MVYLIALQVHRYRKVLGLVGNKDEIKKVEKAFTFPLHYSDGRQTCSHTPWVDGLTRRSERTSMSTADATI